MLINTHILEITFSQKKYIKNLNLNLAYWLISTAKKQIPQLGSKLCGKLWSISMRCRIVCVLFPHTSPQ